MVEDPKSIPSKKYSVYEDDNSDLETTSSKSKEKTEWEKLKEDIKTEFPEKMVNFISDGMSPKQRLVAFAHVKGWINAKISKEGKVIPSTVGRWLKDAKVQAFINAIEFHLGKKDVKEYYKQNAFVAAKLLVDTMNDTSLGIQLRVKAAQTVLEKSKEGEDAPDGDADKPITMKDIFSQLQKTKVDIEEEESSGSSK